MGVLAEKTLSTEQIFDGVLLKVYRDEVELPDGRASVREYIRHPGAAVMIPVREDGSIVFERQYRYPVGAEMVELPAGKIDPGESPQQSAERELLEETGYRGGQFISLGKLHPGIGYSDEQIFIYLVTDLEYHQENQDSDEFIETFEWSLEEGLEAIRTGVITDAKTIIALFRAEKYLDGSWQSEPEKTSQ